MCPHCRAVVAAVNLREVTVHAGLGNQWRGVAYTCFGCGAVLSVGIDPVALKTDMIEELFARLRR